MKKLLILFFLAAFASTCSLGNIATPQAYISEIYFDSTGNWTIELGFPWFLDDIDSMRLVTFSGSSVISSYSLIETGDDDTFMFLALITDTNIAFPITISPEADYVKIISYAWDEQPYDSVAFGSYPGSLIDCVGEEESVITLIYYNNGAGIWEFCIDGSPTIGAENDTTGAMGTFAGIAYDPEGNPFTEGKIYMPEMGNLCLTIQPDGSFSGRVPSRRYIFDTVAMITSYRALKYFVVEPFEFCIQPDSSFFHEIITIYLITDIEEHLEGESSMVTVAPNPFSDKVTFYFDGITSKEITWFSIYSMDGKQLERVQLEKDQQQFDWNPTGDVPSGTYIYRLESARATLKTGKFVRL